MSKVVLISLSVIGVVILALVVALYVICSPASPPAGAGGW
jgi:hypothetical protein